MDKLSELTHGAKVVLGAAIAFLIVSFFNWFELDLGEAVEAFTGDVGVSMWTGIGWLAGLLAIALIVWQSIRLANINLEVGVTPAMITAVLAILMLIFTVIRFIATPGSGIAGEAIDRTIWAWIGLVLAIVVCAGAWANMKQSGESFGSMRDQVTSLTSGGGDDTAATAAPAAPAPAAPTPAEPAAPAAAPPAPAEPPPSPDPPAAAEPATESAPAETDAGDEAGDTNRA